MYDQTARNWFDLDGQDYARFRPTYPPELADALAGLATSRTLAVDVGCGTGQLTVQLAASFDLVIGADPSAEQLAHTAAHPRVRYVRAAAEDLPVADRTARLITAAQAAHWFDLPAFYRAARRIAAPGAVLALVSYGTPRLDPDLDARLRRFHRHQIAPYWPAARRLVDQGYRTLDFPFPEITIPPLSIDRRMDLAELLGYAATWSAVRAASRAGDGQIMTEFADDLARLWGDPTRPRQVIWPINLRIGAL